MTRAAPHSPRSPRPACSALVALPGPRRRRQLAVRWRRSSRRPGPLSASTTLARLRIGITVGDIFGPQGVTLTNTGTTPDTMTGFTYRRRRLRRLRRDRPAARPLGRRAVRASSRSTSRPVPSDRARPRSPRSTARLAARDHPRRARAPRATTRSPPRARSTPTGTRKPRRHVGHTPERSRSWAWRPPVTTPATGWSRPTAASSPSATPASSAPPAAST